MTFLDESLDLELDGASAEDSGSSRDEFEGDLSDEVQGTDGNVVAVEAGFQGWVVG